MKRIEFNVQINKGNRVKKPFHILPDLIGKFCRLTDDAFLECEFFGMNPTQTRININYQKSHNVVYRFLKEKPFFAHGQYFYCVADRKDLENWFWYTLNQLVICKE